MSGSRRQVSWNVKPNPSLIDDKINIEIEGLEPKQDVTLSIQFRTDNQTWISHAHYITDIKGNLDLSGAASLGGRYTGIHPCGLFWSAYIPNDPFSRFHIRDLDSSHETNVSVSEGHLTEDQITKTNPLSQTTVLRRYKSMSVQRVPIRDGRLRGTLFIPHGSKDDRFPAVIDLFGTTGGLLESRAALLASRGFNTLALAYFGYEDLPKTFEFLDLEYFEEAVNWLGNHEKTISEKIGVIGTSKGAEIAYLMSTICDKVRGVVAINGSAFNSTFKHSYRGNPIDCIMPDLEHAIMVDDAVVLNVAYERAAEEKDCYIPVESSDTAEFLIIHGSEDALVMSSNGGKVVQRLLDKNKTNFSLHTYQETPLQLGGRNPLHAYAQEDAWQRILAFFNRTLTPQGRL